MNQGKINKFLAENKGQLTNLSISILAQKIGVSPSAITRFCQINGYSGYKEFNMLIKQRQSKMDKITNLQAALSKTNERLDWSKINFVAQKIIKAQQIYLLGESFTYLQALIFERKLMHLNINAKALNVASELSLILPKKEAVYLFISHSGRNKNLKRVAEKLRFKKALQPFLIALSATPFNNLSNLANESLSGITFYQQKVTETEIPSDSLIIMQVLLDTIFEVIFNLDSFNHRQLLSKLAVEKE